MLKFIKDLLTECDNSTYCLARVSSAVVIMTFLGGAGYDVYINHVFHYIEFATGAMQILGGSAAIIGAKSITTGK